MDATAGAYKRTIGCARCGQGHHDECVVPHWTSAHHVLNVKHINRSVLRCGEINCELSGVPAIR